MSLDDVPGLGTATAFAKPLVMVFQAGSLHADLAYVLVLGVILLWWLGGLP